MAKRKKGRRRRNINTDLQNTTQKTVAFLFIVYSLSSLSPIVCWRVHVLFTLFVAFLFIVYSLSSLCPIVCWRVHVLFTLFVFIVHSGVQHLLCCVFVSCVFVLCTVCSQFLWIVHFRLPHPLFIL